ncbi:MAG: hypothetical protein JSW28_10810 [Thermoplasmata archaeon]|nr:MAG: hypothetical protein JSW28_10810 [Thermoplasmata archaeon]
MVCTVPLHTSASDKHSIEIGGTWQQGAQSGDVESAFVQLIVLPFSLCEIYCAEPEKEVESGKRTSFIMQLENKGNCDDEYTIEVTNIKDLEAEGVSVDVTHGIPVEQHKTEDVEVDVQVSSDIDSKASNIEIVITGTAEKESDEFWYRLNLRIKEGIVSQDIPTSVIIVIIVIVIILAGILGYRRRRADLPRSQSIQEEEGEEEE